MAMTEDPAAHQLFKMVVSSLLVGKKLAARQKKKLQDRRREAGDEEGGTLSVMGYKSNGGLLAVPGASSKPTSARGRSRGTSPAVRDECSGLSITGAHSRAQSPPHSSRSAPSPSPLTPVSAPHGHAAVVPSASGAADAVRGMVVCSRWGGGEEAVVPHDVREQGIRFDWAHNEVHEIEALDDDNDDHDPDDDKLIDCEDLLRPLFDELLQAGKSERDIVLALQEWMAKQMAEVPDDVRSLVQTSVDKLFNHAHEEIQKATQADKERHTKLFSAVKGAVETEVDIIQKKLQGGSFRQNLLRLASSRVHSNEENEWKECVAKLEKQISDLMGQLDNVKTSHTNERKQYDNNIAEEQRLRETDAHHWRTELEAQRRDYDERLSRVMAENQQLTHILTEMRQWKAMKEKEVRDNAAAAAAAAAALLTGGGAGGGGQSASEGAQLNHSSARDSRPSLHAIDHAHMPHLHDPFDEPHLTQPTDPFTDGDAPAHLSPQPNGRHGTRQSHRASESMQQWAPPNLMAASGVASPPSLLPASAPLKPRSKRSAPSQATKSTYSSVPPPAKSPNLPMASAPRMNGNGVANGGVGVGIPNSRSPGKMMKGSYSAPLLEKLQPMQAKTPVKLPPLDDDHSDYSHNRA